MALHFQIGQVARSLSVKHSQIYPLGLELSRHATFAHPGPGPMADASPLSVHIATSPEGSRTHGGVSQSKGQQTQKMDADQASHLNCFFCT